MSSARSRHTPKSQLSEHFTKIKDQTTFIYELVAQISIVIIPGVYKDYLRRNATLGIEDTHREMDYIPHDLLNMSL